jgi:hypothetical protein
VSRYYNMTRGQLVVVLRDGTTASLPARGSLSVTPEQDLSADIHAKLRKGMLKRIDRPAPVPAPQAVPAAPEPQIEVTVEAVPQDLVEAPGAEVAEDPSSSVELEAPLSDDSAPAEETSEGDRRFGKHHRRHGKHRS